MTELWFVRKVLFAEIMKTEKIDNEGISASETWETLYMFF